MDCKRIQELIVTDYIDGEASAAVQDRIKAHIASCTQCRAFEQAARRNADTLRMHAGTVQPPDSVWERIRDRIDEEQPEAVPSALERLFEHVRERFIIRRPAYAFAAAFTVMLAVVVFWGVPLRRQMLVKDYLSQKSAFMLAMNRPANGDLDRVSTFNTVIEEYLF